MPNKAKIDFVSSLYSTLNDSKNFVVIGFAKTSHKDLEELRKSLRAAGSSMTVVKNSLFKVTAQKLKHTELLETTDLKGSSAVITLPLDWTAALSAFYKFAKSHDTVGFKAGIIEYKTYGKDDLMKLAQLPSKEELVVKIILSLRSSHTSLVRSLNFNTQKLIQVIQAAANKS